MLPHSHSVSSLLIKVAEKSWWIRTEIAEWSWQPSCRYKRQVDSAISVWIHGDFAVLLLFEILFFIVIKIICCFQVRKVVCLAFFVGILSAETTPSWVIASLYRMAYPLYTLSEDLLWEFLSLKYSSIHYLWGIRSKLNVPQ